LKSVRNINRSETMGGKGGSMAVKICGLGLTSPTTTNRCFYEGGLRLFPALD